MLECFEKADFPRIFEVLISLLAEQEGVEIEYILVKKDTA